MRSRTFICPGSFDPVTNGHVDIILRARKLCDHLIVLVLENEAKSTVLSLTKRVALLQDVCQDIEGVEVQGYAGLLVDYAKMIGATALVRGIRSEVDFAYENVMAGANHMLAPDIETVFLPAKGALSYMSSSIVRSVAMHGGDIKKLVPAVVAERIKENYAKPKVEE